MSRGIPKILSSVIDGSSQLQPEDALGLFDMPIQVLGHAAMDIRRRLNGDECVTYLIDRNINYTNICDIRCKFCAFSVDAEHPDAYILSDNELRVKLKETVTLGGSGVLLQGGCQRDTGIEYLRGIFSVIRKEFPTLRIHALSPPEIVYLAEKEESSIEGILSTLIDAGLDSLPGGGAEILVDNIREKVAPNKCSSDQWIEVMWVAHKLGLKTSATMMFGHIESHADRIEHMKRIRDLQDETGGFVAFIPWTFQPGNTELEDEVTPATGTDYLRTLAISRIMLDNIPHIGASWLTQGVKLGQTALHFGADDIGSVMLEENVVASAGCENRTTAGELERLIQEAGFTPSTRDAVYNCVDRT